MTLVFTFGPLSLDQAEQYEIYDLCVLGVLEGILDKVAIMSVIWPGIGERCLCKEQEKCRSAVKSELNNIH